MDEFLYELFKTTKFYENFYVTIPATYFSVLALLTSTGRFNSQKENLLLQLSLNNRDKTLYSQFIDVRKEKSVKNFDYVLLTITFSISFCFAVWASYVYATKPASNPISQVSLTIISLSELSYFSLLILSIFEFFYLFRFKLNFAYQSMLDHYKC